jgi:hypothetical protein
MRRGLGTVYDKWNIYIHVYAWSFVTQIFHNGVRYYCLSHAHVHIYLYLYMYIMEHIYKCIVEFKISPLKL